MRLVALALFVGLLGLAACDGEEAPYACKPGATITCDCGDGTEGTGVCSADGTRFGVCACGASACGADLFNDPENCGACAHSCEGGGCVDARCLPVTLTTEAASALALTSDAVYFAYSDPMTLVGGVKRMPLAGGATTTLAYDQGRPHDLLVDTARVVWANGGTPYGIWTAPLAGGAPTALIPDVDAYRLAMDATNVYWSSGPDLRKAPLAGGAAVTLASPSDCRPFDIVVDATTVYFTCASNQSPSYDTLHAVPIAGGADAVIVDDPEQFGYGIVVAGSTLGWTVQSGVHTAPVTGGEPTTLIDGLSFAGAIATDGASFFVNSSGGWVTRVPVEGGRPVVIATQLDPSPGDVAVDEAFVYLAGPGGIQRIAK